MQTLSPCVWIFFTGIIKIIKIVNDAELLQKYRIKMNYSQQVHETCEKKVKLKS